MASKLSYRRLLAIIRSDFERIHDDLKFKPTELIPVFDHPELAVNYQELCVYEQNGVSHFPRVLGEKIVSIDVQRHLNGVDLSSLRWADVSRQELGQAPVRLFISYSHKDERFRLQLEPHLKLLQRQGLISAWHDRLIKAGTVWKDILDENLRVAQIILLLVSSDFIARLRRLLLRLPRTARHARAGIPALLQLDL